MPIPMTTIKDGVSMNPMPFLWTQKEQQDTDQRRDRGITRITDDDNDGMPGRNEWEIRYGLNPLAKDADTDTDERRPF
ncbi:MAG: hypothetical protein R2941_21295 [Desulfobacterales bacterium]